MNPAINPCVSIIFNPTSGKEDPEKRKQAIVDSLKSHGYTCQFLATSKEKGARELAGEMLKTHPQLVVVSGGDGTVMEVLAALVGSSVPVAVLPAGTGNLLSVNLGIPTPTPKAVEVALTGKPRTIDLAKTSEGRYFAIMGGIGVDAQLIHDADRESKDRLGVFAYFQSAWKNRLRHRIWVTIQLDDQPPLRRKVKTILVANMGKITGGLKAVPTADPTNGSLEVTIISVSKSWEWLRVLFYALAGKTQADPKVDVHCVQRVAIHCDRPERVQFDGEDGGLVRELSVELVPKAVTVLV